jgi:UDP-3-O-[3-hydroxymyristoyl] N-acetylglucosamine deacetylase
MKDLIIPAIAENVGDTSLSTALVKDDVKISTIEHLAYLQLLAWVLIIA